jgi:hypothetical protein
VSLGSNNLYLSSNSQHFDFTGFTFEFFPEAIITFVSPNFGALNGGLIVRLVGCADTSAQQFVLVTGIDSPNARNPWTLHPNPVQNDLYIRAEGLTEIRVINMLGQCVKTKPFVEGPATTLSLGDLPAGVYRIELQGPDRMEMQMVVKNR